MTKEGWLTGDQFSDFLTKLLENVDYQATPKRPAPVVFMGGWPFMGKTTIIARATAAPANISVPCEVVIKSRAWRAKRKLDGCTAEAHDMEALESLVSILAGGDAAQLPAYCWQEGKVLMTRGDLRTIKVGRGGAVFVDGTVATLLPRKPNDISFFFQPDVGGVWLDDAVERDITERNWASDTAYEWNRAKAATCVEYKRRGLESKHIDFVVDAATTKEGFVYKISRIDRG